MKIGTMRERVTIYSPTDAQDMSGEATLTWDTVMAEVWASVDGLSTRDILQAQQANVIASHRIRIRRLDGLTHTHRLVWRGRTMEIASVTERETRTVHELLVREVQ